MAGDPTILWLLDRGSDPAIRWQALSGLWQDPAAAARQRARLTYTGWVRRLLDLQAPDGQWGGGLYSRKWTSTTYTLLLLRQLGLAAPNRKARRGASLLLDRGLYRDGGINFWLPWRRRAETCVTGMVLGIAARFLGADVRCDQLAEHLLSAQMPDGGWNCLRWRGATHSSLHTTILALEGLLEYEHAGGAHAAATAEARQRGHEFLYVHRLFRSHRTGAVIHPAMTRFPFPPQWHYDVLRALDYLRSAGVAPDPRLQDGIDLVRSRRRADGTWHAPPPWRGQYHFALEEPGAPSRCNTLRALRVLQWWSATHSR